MQLLLNMNVEENKSEKFSDKIKHNIVQVLSTEEAITHFPLQVVTCNCLNTLKTNYAASLFDIFLI